MSSPIDRVDSSTPDRPRLPSISMLLNSDEREVKKPQYPISPGCDLAPISFSTRPGSLAFLGLQSATPQEIRLRTDLAPLHAPPSPPQSEASALYSRSSSVSMESASGSTPTTVQTAARRLAKRRAHSSATRRIMCAQCGHRDCHIPGHIKTRKEKKSRKDQQRVHQYTEDSLEFIAGVDRSDHKRQSSGNGDVSGLQYSKIETMDGWLAVAIMRIQLHRDQAIIENRLAEFEAENKAIFEAALATGNPVAHTALMAPGDEICEHGGRQKGCDVHGHADWTECRKQRAAANVARHDAEIRAAAAKTARSDRSGAAMSWTAV